MVKLYHVETVRKSGKKNVFLFNVLLFLYWVYAVMYMYIENQIE